MRLHLLRMIPTYSITGEGHIRSWRTIVHSPRSIRIRGESIALLERSFSQGLGKRVHSIPKGSGKGHQIHTDLYEALEIWISASAGEMRAGAILSLQLDDVLLWLIQPTLVGEVVAGRQGTGAEFLQRAQSLGIDFGDGPLVAVAVETVGTTTRHELTEEVRLANRLRIADELRAAARECECAALVALCGDRVIAVMADPKRRPLIALIDRAIDAATECMARHDPSVSVFAGTSSEVTADALHRGIEEAAAALTFGRRSGTCQGVHHFSDLGTYQLLMSLAQGPDLARFVECELRALLDHDASARSKLLPTLRAYLVHSGRKSETVRDLGIQRRTLYARVEKLEEILQRDLESQDTRTRLTLALQGLELLQDRWTRNSASRQMMSTDSSPF